MSGETAPGPQSLAEILREGGEPALICPDDGRVVSFTDLSGAVRRLAGQLAGLGVGPGQRVAMALPAGPEVLIALLGAAVTGAVAAPLNPGYTRDEYTFYLEDLDPSLILVPAGGGDAARAAGRAAVVADLTLGGRGAPALTVNGAPVTRERPFGAASPEDVALLLHTSGTTRRPKQVPLLHRNLMASARAIATHYRLRADDVSYCAMPLFHVHGLVASALAQLVAGGPVVTPRRLNPRRYWEQLAVHRVTWVSASPAIHQMLADRAPQAPPAVRFVRSCSSALSPAVMARLEDLYGCPVLEAYGMTEASHQMTANPLPPAARRPGSVGIEAGARVRIVDARGRDVPAGQAGEVAVQGPGLTPGYLGAPEANAEAFFDGWFRTGDRGALVDGYLFLEGRIKELINRGGENISPMEVEEVLKAHPSVADAVCFPVADEKYGEVVGAAVVLTAEAEVRELRDHCRRSLADFKVPRVIHVVETIPRTPTGKPQRARVAALLEGRNA